MKQPLAYQTGSEARYGFTDFTILRAVIEKVTDCELPTLLDRGRPLAAWTSARPDLLWPRTETFEPAS